MTTPAGDLTAGLSENGRTIFLTAGERLLVDLGPGWTAPRINVLGGDPGPVTTPLRQETGPLANQTATAAGTSTTHVFLAVTAGNTLITAQPDPSSGAGTPLQPGSTFEVTVHVNPRPGFKAPGAQPN
jgi:hypothetical protein